MTTKALRVIAAVLMLELVCGAKLGKLGYSGCPMAPADVIPTCPMPDAWYRAHQCDVPRKFVVSTVENACEGTWEFFEGAIHCSLWFMPQNHVRDFMLHGCQTETGSFVYTEEAVRESVKVVMDACRLDSDMVHLDNVQVSMLDAVHVEGCAREAEDEFVPERATRKEAVGTVARGNTACQRSCHFRYSQLRYKSCNLCCPDLCMRMHPQWRIACCIYAFRTRTCSCSRNMSSNCFC